MPLWGNTDTQGSKPKFPVERLAEYQKASVAVTQAAPGTSINIDGADALMAATEGLNVNVAGNNITVGTYVASYDVANSLVILSATTTGNVVAGDVISFGNNIGYHTNTYETTMNADTVLVTATRMANVQVNADATQTGWVHIRKKVNNDGSVRYLTETLVALANPVASNTGSGATSNTTVYTGV